MNRPSRLLASVFGFLGQVVAHEERSFEQLDADDGEDELKEQVDDHDDEDVLDGVDDAVEHRLTTRQRARSTDDDRPTTLHGDFSKLNQSILLVKPQVSVTVTQGVSVMGVAGWSVTLTDWPAG